MATIELKDASVRPVALRPEILLALELVKPVYETHGHTEVVVTSLNDGEHMEGSLHGEGLAVDLRCARWWGFNDPEGLTEDVRRVLGPCYDVVFEGDHLHIEFDPKGGE